ncbi:tRNA-specific adenosine deaminase [Zhongshania aliphaticivorans]|uniref:tRNA-specific adenosine deaminase n=1 Tax=Zhongshania aliphaticivorans TaxID=1470434 RepID=A0A5S9NHH7_9GAMM|nr:tRNA adenosine(34) deaminase TadA [Zhongshania aliphaticivorans]CAA0089967.1 tRNA-specific adenosine deaminase [Zhongshania aliphaticivorans]CAA0097134.1 tRNA-specific adenosine deaminase [Zhongshania aliphaticivorans]
MDEFSDEYWMHKAQALALRADALNEVPVGALIVRDNVVIGEGFNQPITQHDPTAHAEIIALRNAGQSEANYRLPNATMYVTVEPCAMCAGAIIHSRVSRLVFGATEPKAGAVCSHLQLFEQPQMNHRVTWRGGVLAVEATAILKAFFARRREEKRVLKSQTL